jgi:ankyrin repeat protein
MTPLHASIHGIKRGTFPAVVQLLLKYGANPNTRNIRHQTPLHTLLSDNPDRLDAFRILVEHGADVDAEDGDGMTPLQLSLEGGHEEVSQLFSGYSRRE